MAGNALRDLDTAAISQVLRNSRRARPLPRPGAECRQTLPRSLPGVNPVFFFLLSPFPAINGDFSIHPFLGGTIV
jgi:hypothetical protein